MTTDPRRRLPLLAGAWAALLLSPLPAAANIAPADPFAEMTPVDSSELAELRGGMMIGNIPVAFAITRTVSGTLASGATFGLETHLAINDSGHVAGYTSTPLSSPASATAGTNAPIVTTSSAGVTTISAGSTTVSTMPTSASTAPASASTSTSTAANTSSGVVAPGSVVTLTSGSGDTQFVQQISTAGIQTLVRNAADGSTVRSSTSIDVTLGNILQKTQAFSSQLHAARIGAEAALAGLRR